MSLQMIVGLVIGVLVLSYIFLDVTGLKDSRMVLALLPPIEGLIRVDGFSVIITRDLETLNAADHATHEELGRMQQDGRVFFVTRDTRVRILEIEARYDQIQVLDGEFAGRIGFISSAQVRQ